MKLTKLASDGSVVNPMNAKRYQIVKKNLEVKEVRCMMTYLRFLGIINGLVTYEYGRSKEEMIGTVSMSQSDNKNCQFAYYESSNIKSFCASTSHALIMINKFIKNNNYPQEYTYAC